MRFRVRSLVLLVPSIMVACAGLDYVKVPTPTQYSSTWTDKDQRAADELEGVRYYLPRPFVHLKQSIPVAQRTAFVSFVLTTDAEKHTTSYVVNLPPNPPTWLTRAVPEKLSISPQQALALSSATPAGAPGAAELQAGKVGDASSTDKQPPAPPSTLKATTGFISETDPVTKLSELMDVVYLPDFEEQYVIQAHTGLGKAEIETKLRNGWAAEVFTQSVDNSNLIPYVIEQVEKASSAAAGIVSTWASKAATGGLAPTDLGALAASGLAQMQGGEVEAAGIEALLGNVLLFKVAEVKFAQPGVYPILKPREILYWLGSQEIAIGSDPEATFELALKQRKLPWIRPDMAFIPCPPFTMVGFNVTTDIFFAPASQPWSLTAGGNDTENPVDDPVALKAALEPIQKALQAARANGPDDVIKHLPDSSFTIEKTQSGNQTKITIKGPGVVFAVGSETTSLKWVRDALRLDEAKSAGSKATLSSDRKVLTVNLTRSLGAIDEGLKQ